MIDTIMIIVGCLSMISVIIGFLSVNKSNTDYIKRESEKIQLLREEKLLTKKKTFRRKRSFSAKIKKLNAQDLGVIYQIAKDKKLLVGELLLAMKINSLK